MKSSFLVLLFPLLALWPVMAQSGPTNDSFANALDLANGNMPILNGSLMTATVEPGEPLEAGTVASVWYKVTPISPRILFQDAIGKYGPVTNSEFTLSLFEQTGILLTDLMPLPILASGTDLSVGRTYYFAVSSKGMSSNSFSYPLRITAGKPLNDDLKNAEVLSPEANVTISGLAEGATREPDEPYNPGGVASVWYKWVPANSGRVSITTRFWSQPAQYALYGAEGASFTDLVEIGRNNDTPYVNAGSAYYIGVYDSGNLYFPFEFTLEEQIPSTGPAPGNDSFSNAQRLEGATFTVMGSNLGATREANEALVDDGASGATVWYSWVAPFEGRGGLSTSTRFGPLHVAIYHGNELQNLERVSGDFEFQEGQTYYFQIDTGRDGFQEDFEISLQTESFDLPNDNFSGADDLLAWQPTLLVAHAFMKYATLEPGEPEPVSYPHKSVWWRFTPAWSGDVSVTSRSFTPQANVTMAAYQGASLDTLRLVAKGETFFMNVTEGSPLWIEAVVPSDGNEEVFCDIAYLGNGDSRLAQAIEWAALPNVTLGRGPILLDAKTSSGLPVNYDISTWSPYVQGEPAPAHLDGNVLTIDRPGVLTISCSANGSETYKDALSISRTFIIFPAPSQSEQSPKGSQQIQFDPIDTSREPFSLSARATSGLPVSFEVVSGPASIDGSHLVISAGQPVTVRAVQPGDATYAAANPVYQTVLLQPLPQTIELMVSTGTAEQSQAKVFGAKSKPLSSAPASAISHGLNAKASSGLPVDLSVVSGPALLEGTILRFTGPGDVVVRAIQAGDSIFQPASLDRTFHSDVKLAQTLVFSPPPSLRFGDPAVPFSAIASSGLPVSFEIVSGPAAIISGELTLLGTGTVVVRAIQPGNDQYLSTSLEAAIRIERAPQTVEFEPPNLSFATNVIQLNAQASSGLPVAYEILEGAADLSGNVLTILASGTVRIRVSQPGNENFEPIAVERTIVVGKGQQSISLESLPPLTYGDAPVRLSATASTGLPVSFEAVSGPISITRDILTISGAGVAMFRVIQPGDENYFPATLVREMPIAKRAQTVSFQAPQSLIVGSQLDLAIQTSSGLPATLTLISGDAELNGSHLSVQVPGPITLESTQPGNENYEVAAPVRVTINVLPLPKVSIRKAGTMLLLEWPPEYRNLRVQRATSVSGPWQDSDSAAIDLGAAGPDDPTATGFFRLKEIDPVSSAADR